MSSLRPTEQTGQTVQFGSKTAVAESRGKFIKGAGKGKKKTRLSLTENHVYNIAAKKIDSSGKPTRSSLFHKARYVRVKQGSDTYDVNIGSLAKRLGISRGEARKLAEGEGGIGRMQQEAHVREEAIERYNRIAEQYGKHQGKLQTKDGLNTGLKPSTILKVVQKGLEIGEDGKVKTKPQQLAVGKHIVRISEGGQLSVLQKAIGEGSNGAVFQTLNINKAKLEAMKEAHDKKANEKLFNEHKVLLYLQDGKADKKIEGIQSAPREVTTINTGETQKAFYQTDLADGSIDSSNSKMQIFNALPQRTRLDLCKQLLSGLAHAHTYGESPFSGVVHGDIKPENCLMHLGDKGYPERFELADWGGSGINEKAQSYTPAFYPTDISDRGIAQAKRADVFAISLTLVMVLSGGEMPELQTSNEGSPIPVESSSKEALAIRKNLQEKGIDEKVINVLIKGLGRNRPPAFQLKAEYEQAISSVSKEPVDLEAIQKLKDAVYMQQILDSSFL